MFINVGPTISPFGNVCIVGPTFGTFGNIFGNVYYVRPTGYYVPQISERFQLNIAEITAECSGVKLFGR